MRVLVTGAAGFIGSHLCDYLLALGHEVAGIDILVPQVHGGTGLQWKNMATVPEWPAYMDERVKAYIMDAGNRNEVLYALAEFQPEIVVHLAAYVGVGQSWYEPSMYLYGGPVITAAVMEAVHKYNETAETRIRRLFVAGSMSSYGEGPVGMDEHSTGAPEDWPLTPENPYAFAKEGGERIALTLGPSMDIEVVVGRFFNVAGERQALTNPYTGVAAIFAARLLTGQAPVVFEDGQQSRDFIHVSDVVRAIWTIVEQGQSGSVYNVGTGARTTILKLAETLCEISGTGLAPIVTGATRSGDIRHCFADASKLRALGWEPEVTFQDAVARVWDWVSAQADVDPEAFQRALGELLGRGLVQRLAVAEHPDDGAVAAQAAPTDPAGEPTAGADTLDPAGE